MTLDRHPPPPPGHMFVTPGLAGQFDPKAAGGFQSELSTQYAEESTSFLFSPSCTSIFLLLLLLKPYLPSQNIIRSETKVTAGYFSSALAPNIPSRVNICAASCSGVMHVVAEVMFSSPKRRRIRPYPPRHATKRPFPCCCTRKVNRPAACFSTILMGRQWKRAKKTAGEDELV